MLDAGASPRLLSGDIREPLASTFSLFLLQVLVILTFSRVVSELCRLIKQPGVVGEMVAGILLGPTALGKIPGWKAVLFPASSLDTLSTVASFGLCFFMLAVGMEMDIPNVTKNWRVAFALSFAGLAVPCAASYGLAVLFAQPAFSSASVGVLGLFLTVALGIISLPVLARILKERKVDTRLQELALSVAVVEDILAYILLAIVTVLVKPSVGSDSIGIIVGATVAECLFVFVVLQSAVKAIVERSHVLGKSLDSGTFLFLCVCLLVCCLLTNVIGLSFMIGAFQMGMIIPRASGLAHQIQEKVEFFATTVLMPIYFAVSGLKTDFSKIDSAESWGLAILLIVVAIGSKYVSVYAACRAVAIPPIMSKVVSALMTCKGLIALVVLNVGLDAKAITQKFFSILVLMVLVATVGTVPLVNFLDPPSNKEASDREMAAYARALDGPAAGAGGSEGAPPEPAAAALRASTPLIGGAREGGLNRRFGRAARGMSLAGPEELLRARSPSVFAADEGGPEGAAAAAAAAAAEGAIVWATAPPASPTFTGIARAPSMDKRSRASSVTGAGGGGGGSGSATPALPSAGGAPPAGGKAATPLLLPAAAAHAGGAAPPLPGFSLQGEAAPSRGEPPAAPSPPRSPAPRAAAAPPPRRFRILAAFTEPSSVASLAALGDLFAPLPEAGQPHHGGASLAVHWLQGNLDMASSLISGEGLEVLDKERHEALYRQLSGCAAARTAVPPEAGEGGEPAAGEPLPHLALGPASPAAEGAHVLLEVGSGAPAAPLSPMTSLTPVPEEAPAAPEDGAQAGEAAAAAVVSVEAAPAAAATPPRSVEAHSAARTPEHAAAPRAALAGQNGSALAFVASISGSPWQDAQAAAAREGAHLLLCTSRFPVLSQGAIEVTSLVLAQVAKDMKSAWTACVA